jgi:hypothetical protein
MSTVKPASSSPSTALEPISLSPETGAQLGGFSVRTVYRLLGDKAFKARRMGGRTLIDYPSFRDYLRSLPEYIAGISVPNAPHMTGAGSRRAGKRRQRRA